MEPSTFGGRLRAARFARNLTLQQLGDLAGFSESYLYRLERGERALDKGSTAAKIAHALGIDTAQLTGITLEHADPEVHEAQATITPIRLAIVTSKLGRRTGDVRPVEAIIADVDELVALRMQAKLAEMGRALPPLIVELYSATAGPAGEERDEACRQLVRVLASAMTVPLALEYPDLAYMVADRAVEAAADGVRDAAWVSVAQHGACHAMLPMAGGEAAYRYAAAAADAASAVDSGPGAAAFGSLLLVSAKMAAQAGHTNDAAARLDAALEAAARVGESGPDTAFFGPSNTGLYRMAAALEQDDPETAAREAELVDAAVIASAERRAKFGVDHARALSRLRGRAVDAVASLVAAEGEAPLLVRKNPIARDLVPGLIGAVRPGTTAGRDARGLAWRMGLGSVVA